MYQSQICSSQNVGSSSKTCNFGDDDDDTLLRFSPLREDKLKEMLDRIPLDMRCELDQLIRIFNFCKPKKILMPRVRNCAQTLVNFDLITQARMRMLEVDCEEVLERLEPHRGDERHFFMIVPPNLGSPCYFSKLCFKVNAEKKKLMSLIKEKFGLDLLTSMTRYFDYTASTSGSQPWQLKFLNRISAPVSTGMDIEGEDHKTFIVALVDGNGKIVNTGAGAAATVEIVVLKGGCNDDEAKNWSSNEFNSKIISDWNGTKVLQGNTFLKLNEGIGSVDKISFTHNSTWKRKTNCRLGARPVNAVFFAKEAKSESFLVMDKRKGSNEKHLIPCLDDDVWRLLKICKKGTLAKSLTQAKIKTVGDFIVRLFLNRQCLEEIFRRAKHGKSLEITVNHALTCPTKLKYCSSYDQKPEVVFNVSGEVLGLYLHGQFLSRNILSETQKEDANKLVISAFENWEDVIAVDEDQFVADCSNPVVHGLTKTEIITPCINTLATTYNTTISLDGPDLVINESFLFGNMLSDDPDFLHESLRKQYTDIYGGFENVCTSKEHVLGLVDTKTAKNKRFCRRWKRIVWAITFTRSLPKRSLDDIHAHKKPRFV